MRGPALVIGLGLTGRAACRALAARGVEVVAVDDRPTDDMRAFAADAGVRLVEGLDGAELERLVVAAERVLPTPGLPDRHELMHLARRLGARIQSEFDLAAEWDDRPIAAVTGTDGKTTVTTMVAAMLERSGIPCLLAGNNDTPLVEAVDDPRPAWFVVEASSFRIGHSEHFAPRVATWLNFAPDHLDVHQDLAAYEEAKASIFDHQPSDGIAITNAGDPVVARHRGRGPARPVTFGADEGDYRVLGDDLVGPDGRPIVAVAELARRAPHDVENALAAAATAIGAGAELAAVAEVLTTFEGLPHRQQLVAEHDGITYVDDSKATVPHAAITAIGSFPRVVLIAGGRNKGLDLTTLTEAVSHLVAVVAIGDAAAEVAAAFAGAEVPVVTATSMEVAVGEAVRLARPGDTVLLSPGCASHDWYADYAERGDDFARAVRDQIGATP